MGTAEKERFFREHIAIRENDLLRFVTTITKDRELAADVVQETMEVAWCHLDDIKCPESIWYLLCSVAKNKVTSYYRKNKAVLSCLPLDETDILDSKEEDFLVQMIHREDRRLVLFLISRLREDYGRILLLHYYYDLSLKEIGEITQANYNTIVSWHRRALKQLGILLSRHDSDL